MNRVCCAVLAFVVIKAVVTHQYGQTAVRLLLL